MTKQSVKIFDTNFAHAIYSSDFQESKYITWDRQKQINDTEPVFITDNSLYQEFNIKNPKIAWLLEPRSINPNIYEYVKNNHHKFDIILTYDKELLSINNKFKFYPHSGCWIKTEDQKIHDKTKLLSIIASGKNQTPGHKLRHDIINSDKNKMDVYGRGYNPVENKITALKDYAFSIIIENIKTDYYFTEKLIDAFITGVVPIYFGCPSIGDIFNIDGMIIVDDLTTLQNEINSLSLDRYKSMKKAIKENFDRVQSFKLAEDWIYRNTNIFNNES